MLTFVIQRRLQTSHLFLTLQLPTEPSKAVRTPSLNKSVDVDECAMAPLVKLLVYSNRKAYTLVHTANYL